MVNSQQSTFSNRHSAVNGWHSTVSNQHLAISGWHSAISDRHSVVDGWHLMVGTQHYYFLFSGILHLSSNTFPVPPCLVNYPRPEYLIQSLILDLVALQHYLT